MFAVQLVGENWFDICFLSEVLYVKISILNKKNTNFQRERVTVLFHGNL